MFKRMSHYIKYCQVELDETGMPQFTPRLLQAQPDILIIED